MEVMVRAVSQIDEWEISVDFEKNNLKILESIGIFFVIKGVWLGWR